MTSKEYASYIKGLIDGAGLDTATPEGKVISALADLASKLAAEVDSLTEQLDTANDYLDELDHDLGELEEYVYDDEDGEDDDEDDDDGFDDEEDEDEDEEEDEEEEFYCVECPNCGGKVYFDDTVNPEDVICPNCHKAIIEEDPEDTDADSEDKED